MSFGDSEPNSQADMRPGGDSSDKGASAFTGSGPEISALSCLWTTLSYSSQWRVATLGLEWGQRSKGSPHSTCCSEDWNWRTLRRRRDAEERALQWLFLLIFLKLALSLLVNGATVSHLLSRRCDKDKRNNNREQKRKGKRKLTRNIL